MREVIQVMTTYDNFSLMGVVGFIMGISAPWLDFLNAGIQLCAGLGGLVLLTLGIIHKYYQVKEMRKKK